MADGKLSPRQRMINMMYLVLIALLALNVSKEILKSFYLMEKSFVNATASMESKSKATMVALNTQFEKNPKKTEPYMARAKGVQDATDKYINYLDAEIAAIEKMYDQGDGARETEGEDKGAMIASDQMEKHANYFVVENQGAKGKEFMEKINSAREEILAFLKPGGDSSNITKTDLYDKALEATQLKASGEHWIEENLEHQPASGLMAIFARIKQDARALEADALEKLAAQIDATDYKFDKLEAKILPTATSVMQGDPYEADILLVASNSKGSPKILVGGNSINVEGGVGKFKAGTSSVGPKSYSGKIVLDGPEGIKEFEFKGEYNVFAPSATIAATEMNLLYIGIDNPMTISASGFDPSQYNVSAPGANLVKTRNGYNCKVSKGTKEVTVGVTLKTGKSLGKQRFRVRSLPQPVAQLGGLRNDGLPKAKAQVYAQPSILASMGPGFAYNLKWRVTSFRFILQYARKPAFIAQGSGGTLTGPMQNVIRSASKGDRVIIEGIKASEQKYGFKSNLTPIVIPIR